MKLTGCSAALILAWGLTGCHTGHEKAVERTPSPRTNHRSENTTIMKNQTTNPTVRQLIVSKPNDAGFLARIGTLDFDESNRATLSTAGSGPAVDELKRVWPEMSKMEKLTWVHTRPNNADGKQVTQIVGEDAKPGDGKYFYAVLDTLSRKYGYTVDIAK